MRFRHHRERFRHHRERFGTIGSAFGTIGSAFGTIGSAFGTTGSASAPSGALSAPPGALSQKSYNYLPLQWEQVASHLIRPTSMPLWCLLQCREQWGPRTSLKLHKGQCLLEVLPLTVLVVMRDISDFSSSSLFPPWGTFSSSKAMGSLKTPPTYKYLVSIKRTKNRRCS